MFPPYLLSHSLSHLGVQDHFPLVLSLLYNLLPFVKEVYNPSVAPSLTAPLGLHFFSMKASVQVKIKILTSNKIRMPFLLSMSVRRSNLTVPATAPKTVEESFCSPTLCLFFDVRVSYKVIVCQLQIYSLELGSLMLELGRRGGERTCSCLLASSSCDGRCTLQRHVLPDEASVHFSSACRSSSPLMPRL